MSIGTEMNDFIQKHRDFLASLTPDKRQAMPAAGPEIAKGLECLEYHREQAEAYVRNLPLITATMDQVAEIPGLPPTQRAMAVAMARMAEACGLMMTGEPDRSQDLVALCQAFAMLGVMCNSVASLYLTTVKVTA